MIEESPPLSPPGPNHRANPLGCIFSFLVFVGLIALSRIPLLGLLGACIFVAVWDYRFPQSAFHPAHRYSLGVFFYVIGFLSMLPRGCQSNQVGLLAAGFFLAGARPLIDGYGRIQKRLLSINPERWVGIFSMITMAIGVLITAVALVGGLGMRVYSHSVQIGAMQFDWHKLPALITMFAIGGAFFALGLGIRRRSTWAGALGLGLTFWGFADVMNRAISSTGGRLSELPAALLRNSPGILFYWCFFFGFYKVFFPLVAGKADELVGNLESKLRSAERDAASFSRDLGTERIKLSAILESTNEGIALFDEDDRIIFMNPAFRHLFEIDSSGWEGRTRKEILTRPSSELIPVPVLLGKNSQGGSGGEFRFRDSQENVRKVLAFYTKTVLTDAGDFLATMLFSRDVTLEREVDRMKTEFVSNVSHELRTPLTSIRAYAEMLIDGEAQSQETLQDYLHIILDESERLTDLINDILDLSKMESGRKTYSFGPTDPAEILSKVCAVASSGAEKKHVSMETRLPPTSRMVNCDRNLLHQACLNLVNNAVKYTPPSGRIVLELEFFENRYRMSVSDTGPGISTEDQTRLFAKFFRVESSLNQEIGGTGLGLALVKHIAQVHQGSVSVSSELGKGSTFFLDLPDSGPTAVSA
jgi:signal transduction histidine kinase